jgi:hypothetical protein
MIDVEVSMANRQRPTVSKRERERNRQARRKEKEARRQEAKARRADKPAGDGTVDPDLEGIKPGPQPKQDWQDWQD